MRVGESVDLASGPSTDHGEFSQRGRSGAPAYRCRPGVVPGEVVGLPVRLAHRPHRRPGGHRHDQRQKCECDANTTDLNAANDTAAIVVNGGATAGEGGGLPITGPAAGMIAAAGGLLLAAGVSGMVIARRRRTRFVS